MPYKSAPAGRGVYGIRVLELINLGPQEVVLLGQEWQLEIKGVRLQQRRDPKGVGVHQPNSRDVPVPPDAGFPGPVCPIDDPLLLELKLSLAAANAVAVLDRHAEDDGAGLIGDASEKGTRAFVEQKPVDLIRDLALEQLELELALRAGAVLSIFVGQ